MAVQILGRSILDSSLLSVRRIVLTKVNNQLHFYFSCLTFVSIRFYEIITFPVFVPSCFTLVVH